MELCEACDALSESIRAEEYSETGALMIMVFMEAIDDDDTYAMALSLAKSAPKIADSEGS